MSIKRYREAFKKKPKNTITFAGETFIGSLFPKMDKPKRYSMECGDEVHCMTVMPNREVHFHNHPKMDEMVHLVTFDILKNPDMANSELVTCLKVLRGLRTRTPISYSRWNTNDDVLEYASKLLNNNFEVKQYRTKLQSHNNPKPWREEVLHKYKKTIKEFLIGTKETPGIKYYGMTEGFYKFQMNFAFNLGPSFMPSAKMELRKDENSRWSSKILHLDVIVSPKWIISVYLKNRAIILQNLVLNILKEYPNGTCLAMVAKQSHGFKVIPRLAVVDFKRQAISWIIDKDRKEDVLDNEVIPRMRRTKKELEAIKTEAVNEPKDPIQSSLS